jgi:hypothetical protein
MKDSPITDEIIERLLTGSETKEIRFGDVSDIQHYGKLFRRDLDGPWKAAASALACHPVVYLSIEWWTLAYIPVVPRQSLFVMPYLDWDKEDLGMDRYRCLPAPMLRSQMVAHYAIGFSVTVVTILLFWWGQRVL